MRALLLILFTLVSFPVFSSYGVDGSVVQGDSVFVDYPNIPITGLVGYWSFDNCDASDNSGNKLNGTFDGAPGCVAGVSGSSYALKFNGLSDQVRIPNPFIGKLHTLADPYSMSVWINSKTTKSAMSLISSHQACYDNHSGIIFDVYNGSLLGFRPVDGWLPGASAQVGVFDGKWHHLVANYNGGVAFIYVDGALVATSSPVGGGTSSWNFYSEMVIGGMNASACGDFHYEGLMDEVRLYNRALSATEIAALAGAGGTAFGGVSSLGLATEYYHAGFGHYFVTGAADEAAAIDSGAIKGWARTGQTYSVYSQSGTGLSPVCRFFSTSFAPKSSHFYTPSAAECGSVKTNPNWQFEANAFYVKVPEPLTALCPTDTVPLYRIYNNGHSGAPNHRYTTCTSIRDNMISRGWVSEGVAMCIPGGSTNCVTDNSGGGVDYNAAPTATPPTISATTPPSGTVGVAYSASYAASGTAPISFSASGLPPGLSMSTSGVIGGTPTQAGTYSGTVTASNGTSPNATQGFTITISSGATPTLAALAFDGHDLMDVWGTNGAAYVLTVVRKPGGSYYTDPDGTRAYQSELYLLKMSTGGQLSKLKLGDVAPNGETNHGTGALRVEGSTVYAFSNSKAQSGTYGMSGYVYTVDASSMSLANTRTLFTAANWGWYPVIQSGPTISHFSYAGYYRYLDTSSQGRVEPQIMADEWMAEHAAHSGGLVLGGELNDLNGAYRSTVIGRILSRYGSQQTTQTPPVLSVGSLPSGTVGVAYSTTFTATGTAPISFSASGLPPGLSMSPSGVISGTPTQAGTYSGQVVANNGTPPEATQGFTIVIQALATSCTTTLSSSNQSVGFGSTTGSVAVYTPSGCEWAAASNEAWITVTSGSSGRGDGSVGFSVAANTGAVLRTGTVTVGGVTFTVTQAAASTCTSKACV